MAAFSFEFQLDTSILRAPRTCACQRKGWDESCHWANQHAAMSAAKRRL